MAVDKANLEDPLLTPVAVDKANLEDPFLTAVTKDTPVLEAQLEDLLLTPEAEKDRPVSEAYTKAKVMADLKSNLEDLLLTLEAKITANHEDPLLIPDAKDMSDLVANPLLTTSPPWRIRSSPLWPTMWTCLLYTSPSPRDKRQSRMPSSA